MIQLWEFAVAPFRCVRHGAEDVSVERRSTSSRVGQILPLLKLDLKAVLGNILIGSLPPLTLGILEDGPKVGHTKDDRGPLKCGDEAGDVVEVCFHYFHAFGLPLLGILGRRVSANAADFPPGGLQVGIRYRTSLEEDQSK